MEKKNTMLLTTIAVATLLITVVGATFAYFGVSIDTKNSQTVKINGKATKVGIVTVTTPVTEMHLNLTGTEMAYDNRGKWYFASNEEDVPYLTTTKNTTNSTEDPTPENAKHEIFNFSISGGDDSLTYACNVDMGLYKTDKDTMIEFAGNDVALFLYEAADFDPNITGDEYLSTTPSITFLNSSNFSNNEIDFTQEMEVPSGVNYSIIAALVIVNESYDQNIYNKVLDVEFKVNSVDCKIQSQ